MSVCKFVLCWDCSVVLECTTPSPGLETFEGADRDFPPPAAQKRKLLKGSRQGSSPARFWGREGLYTLSWKARTSSGAGWRFLTGFPQTRGSSSGAETCIIFLPPHLSLAQKKRFYPVITLGQQNIKGPSTPQRGKKSLVNFTEEFKLGNTEFIEKRYIFKSSSSELTT